MRRLLLLLPAALLVSVLPLSASAGAKPPAPRPADPSAVEIVVLLKGERGLQVETRTVRPLGIGRELSALRARKDVLAADVDALLTLQQAPDPHRVHQWALTTLKAEDAWGAGTAASQVIGVVDSGVAPHEDLDLVPGWPDGRTSDENGHGTAVAGTAAMLVGNGKGGAGLASGAKVMPIKVCADGYDTAQCPMSTSKVITSMQWAMQQGVRIFNVSASTLQDNEFFRVGLQELAEQGAVIVAASGNAGQTSIGDPTLPRYPAAYPFVLGVGAVGQPDGTTRSTQSLPGAWVDVVAPGDNILTTSREGGYEAQWGTSIASPYGAAAAALVRAKYPQATPADVIAHLKATAVDLYTPGRDDDSGHGRIDPVKALASPPTTTPPTGGGTGPAPAPTPTPTPTPTQPGATPPAAPTSRVGNDPDMTRAAVLVSQTAFGAGTATQAVLSRDDAFADSLAGAALAGTKGPILYTPGGESAALSSATATELQRALRPGSTVYVLGGAKAVSEAATAEVRRLGFTVQRVAGPSRVETAIEIANLVSGRPDRVLLARADDWADAVTGGAYAASAGVPVLLTQPTALHPAVQAYLAQRNPGSVVLLGGRAALGDAVAASVGARATRVSGGTRAATAVEIARQLWGRTSGGASDRFVVVDGYDRSSWSPALAAAVLSATTSGPQLLAHPGVSGGVPAETSDYLRSLSYGSSTRASAALVGPRVGSAAETTLGPLLGG